MVMRPYTAVLVRGRKTFVINIDAALEKEKAYFQIHKKFPADRIVALIPGVHADHSYVFDDAHYAKPDMNIDLFDTSFITKKDA